MTTEDLKIPQGASYSLNTPFLIESNRRDVYKDAYVFCTEANERSILKELYLLSGAILNKIQDDRR